MALPKFTLTAGPDGFSRVFGEDGALTSEKLAGLKGTLTPNIMNGQFLLVDGGQRWIDTVPFQLDADGKLNGDDGIELLANDPSLDLEKPIQWTIAFDKTFRVNGFTKQFAKWTFVAPNAGETTGLHELAHATGFSATTVTRGPRGFGVDLVTRVGNTLRSWVQGSQVGSVDISDLIFNGTADSLTDATTTGKAVVRAANQAAARTAIGGTTVGANLFTAADAAAARDAVGFSTGVARSLGWTIATDSQWSGGADPTGVADSAPAIRAAITGTPSGGTVFLPEGVYKHASGALDLGSRFLRGAGRSTKIIRSNWDINGGFIRARGTLATTAHTTLTANASMGATTLTVASTTGIAVGEYLLLGSNDVFHAAANNKRGEVVQVATIASGTSLTLWTPLRDSYTTANTASLYKRGDIVGGGISGITIDDAEPNTHKMGYIEVQHARGYSIDNVACINAGGAALLLDNVIDSSVTNFYSAEQNDDTSNGWFGYGINVSNSCDSITIADSHFARVRHGVTTTGSGGGRMGVPRNIIVANCTGRACNTPVFDTHPDSGGVSFIGCGVTGSRSAAFQLRGRDDRVVDADVNGAGCGVQVTSSAVDYVIDGGTYRHIRDTGIGGQGNAIRICPGTDGAAPKNGRILGVNAYDIAYAAVRLTVSDGGATPGLDPVGLLIKGCAFANTGQSAAFRSGVYVDDTITMDGTLVILDTVFRNTDGGTGMDYAIRVPATITNSKFIDLIGLGLATGMINDAAGTSTTNVPEMVRRSDAADLARSRGMLVIPGTDAMQGVVIRKRSSSQSGNLFEWQTESGGQYGRIVSDGTVQIGKVGAHAIGGAGIANQLLTLTAGDVTYTPLAVRQQGGQTADLFRAQTNSGVTKSGVLAGGTLFSDDAAQGIVLKDSGGHYWRLTVSTGGVVTTTDLGTTKPTA